MATRKPSKALVERTQINVRFESAAELEEFQKRARAEGLTLSWLVRQLLREHFTKEG